VRHIGAFLTLVVVTLLLRSTALSALAARGVMLDVLAFAVAIWALRRGESWGSTCGFLLGLAADLDAAHWLGRHALALALMGYAVGRLGRTLVRDSARTQLVVLFVCTLLHQAWVSAFSFGGAAGALGTLLRVVVSAAVTAPVGTLILAIVRRLTGHPLFGHASLDSKSSA